MTFFYFFVSVLHKTSRWFMVTMRVTPSSIGAHARSELLWTPTREEEVKQLKFLCFLIPQNNVYFNFADYSFAVQHFFYETAKESATYRLSN